MGVGETEGFRGALTPKPFSAPRGLASRGAFPERPRRGVPKGRMRCSCTPRGVRARPRGDRAPHVGPLSPDAAEPVAAAPARLPGAGPAGGARSPEPGSAPGNRRCFSREGFLERSGDGGVGRAREAGAAAGQPGSAFRALPRNRGDLRASPHPARLLAVLPAPPRPLSRPPSPRPTAPPPSSLTHSSPLLVSMDRHFDLCRGVGGASGPRGEEIRPHLHPLHLSLALPRREPRLLGRVKWTPRFQEED